MARTPTVRSRVVVAARSRTWIKAPAWRARVEATVCEWVTTPLSDLGRKGRPGVVVSARRRCGAEQLRHVRSDAPIAATADCVSEAQPEPVRERVDIRGTVPGEKSQYGDHFPDSAHRGGNEQDVDRARYADNRGDGGRAARCPKDDQRACVGAHNQVRDNPFRSEEGVRHGADRTPLIGLA